jgi:hypothetical protein
MSVNGGTPSFAEMIAARVEGLAEPSLRAAFLVALTQSVWWPGSAARPLRGWNPVDVEVVIAPSVADVCAALAEVSRSSGDPLVTLPAWRALAGMASSLMVGGERTSSFQHVVAEALAAQSQTHPFWLLTPEAAEEWAEMESQTRWTLVRVGSGTYPIADLGGLCHVRLPGGDTAGARSDALENFLAREAVGVGL